MVRQLRVMVRRRRRAILRVLEQSTDDQVLLCACADHQLPCAG